MSESTRSGGAMVVVCMVMALSGFVVGVGLASLLWWLL